MKGEGGVVGEGRLGGEPKFYSWGKSTANYSTRISNVLTK